MTYICVLKSCVIVGSLEIGELIDVEIRKCGLFIARRCCPWNSYCLTLTHGHYTCMIDLFGCGGHFDKAKVVLEKVSSSDRLPQLLAILGACCKWVNVKLGRWAFHISVELDERCVAAYISMENIYLGSGMI